MGPVSYTTFQEIRQTGKSVVSVSNCKCPKKYKSFQENDVHSRLLNKGHHYEIPTRVIIRVKFLVVLLNDSRCVGYISLKPRLLILCTEIY